MKDSSVTQIIQCQKDLINDFLYVLVNQGNILHTKLPQIDWKMLKDKRQCIKIFVIGGRNNLMYFDDIGMVNYSKQCDFSEGSESVEFVFEEFFHFFDGDNFIGGLMFGGTYLSIGTFPENIFDGITRVLLTRIQFHFTEHYAVQLINNNLEQYSYSYIPKYPYSINPSLNPKPQLSWNLLFLFSEYTIPNIEYLSSQH